MYLAFKMAGCAMIALGVALLIATFWLSITGYMSPSYLSGEPDYMLRCFLWAMVWSFAGVAMNNIAREV